MPEILELAYQAEPTALFSRLLALPRPILLHSADRQSRFGRFDIMAAAPHTAVQYQDGQLTVGEQIIPTEQPLAQLAKTFNPRARAGSSDQAAAHFKWGFLGYFGYRLHETLEQQQPVPANPDAVPDLWGGFYDWSVVTDHRRRWTKVFAANDRALAAARSALERPARGRAGVALGRFDTSLTEADYRTAFARTQQYITDGDCYQVNLAKHYQAPFSGHGFDLYQHWLEQQPAPFCAYLGVSTQDAIVCLSPERFLNLHHARASVSPIKGTRPRSKQADTDLLAKLALLSSTKDRAENLMIVDLLRNDLGRVSIPGSVTVRHLFEPVSFANVHHLVSTVASELEPTQGAFDLIQALFPCGSVTGAPKIRAIDIISELEPVGRSAYCGALGYIDADGTTDLCVTIRSAVVSEQQVHLWGGGGLVADSKAEIEQQEIEDKIGRLLR